MAGVEDGATAKRDPPGRVAATELANLLSSSVRTRTPARRLVSGEVIVREGEPGPSAFILLSGSCDVLVDGEILNTIGPGELFARLPVSREAPAQPPSVLAS